MGREWSRTLTGAGTATAHTPTHTGHSSPTYSVVQLHSRQGLLQPRGLHSFGEQSRLRPDTASKQGKGSHCWHQQSQRIGSSLECRLLPGPPQPTRQPMPKACSSPSCSSTAPFWGKGDSAGKRENTIREKGASSDLTLRTSAPGTWDLTLPSIG